MDQERTNIAKPDSPVYNNPTTMCAANASIYEVFDHQKTELLISLLKESPDMKAAIIFVRSRDLVHALTSDLHNAGLASDSIHGSKKAELRERTLKDFLAGKFPALVATESVLRDSDLTSVDHVIYFEPHELDADFLKHLETSKEVITFITQKEHNLLQKLDKLADADLPRKKLEGFPYASQPKNQRGAGGGNKTQSKPLQHKKPKLKNKGPRRKTGRTRKR